MSKRTFASRTFAPRTFNSATWTGEGTAVVVIETKGHPLYVPTTSRHTLNATAETRQALSGVTP